jgi:competence protein ComEC
MTLRAFSIILVIVTTLVTFSFFISWPDDKLHLISCDVGQGDAFLISSGFQQILVDGGEDSRVIQCLEEYMPYWDRRIDLIIATHDDHDHVGGLVEVMKRYRVENIIWNGKTTQSDDWTQIGSEANKQKTKLLSGINKNYVLKDIVINQLWPQDAELENVEDNLASLVMHVKYGQFGALFSGDIDSLTEEKLMSSSLNLASDILKVSHHGSRFSNSDSWLLRVNPDLALISVGKDNSYGHPSPEVIKRLKEKDIDIHRTDQQGSLEIISDGKVWQTSLVSEKRFFNWWR